MSFQIASELYTMTDRRQVSSSCSHIYIYMYVHMCKNGNEMNEKIKR